MTFWGRTCRVGCVRRVKHWLNIKASKITGRICIVDPHLFCFPGGAGSSSGEGEGLAPARCCGGQQLFCVWDVQNHLCGASNAVACEETFWKPVKPKIETHPHSCALAEASAQSICYLPGSPSCSGGWPTQQRDPLDVWQGCYQNLDALKHKDEDKVLDFQTDKFSFQ